MSQGQKLVVTKRIYEVKRSLNLLEISKTIYRIDMDKPWLCVCMCVRARARVCVVGACGWAVNG